MKRKKKLFGVANILIKRIEVGRSKNDSNKFLEDCFDTGDLEAIIHIDKTDQPDVSLVFHNKRYNDKGRNVRFLMVLNREQAMLLGQHLMLSSYIKTED